MFLSAFFWIVMRGAFGFAAASLYMVIESWLNERAPNEARGRIFAAYMTVNYGSLIVGQMLFASNKPTSFTLFDLTAVFYAICLIPVGLTLFPQPQARDSAEAPAHAAVSASSPVGVIGCIAVGLANSAVWAWAPIFAQDHGLTRAWLATFMSVLTLGGAVIQLPLGRLSDLVDRRLVIAGDLHRIGGDRRDAVYVRRAWPERNLLFADRPVRDHRAAVLWIVGRACERPHPARVLRRGIGDAVDDQCAGVVFRPDRLPRIVIDHFGTASLFLYTAAIHVAMAVFILVRLRDAAPLIGETKDRFEPMPPQGSPAALELDPRGPEEKAA